MYFDSNVARDIITLICQLTGPPWYERDFGFGEKGVLDHLRRYANPRLAERLANINSIASDSYDWRLNDTAAYRRLPEG